MHDDEHGWGHRHRIGDDLEVHVYEDGHIDIDERRLIRNVKHGADVWVGQKIFGCVFGICFIMLFAAIIAGAGWYIWATVDDGSPPFDIPTVSTPTPTSTQTGSSKGDNSAPSNIPDIPFSMDNPAKPVWGGTAPLICGGNEKLVVHNVTASLKGQTAIVAKANCQLTLVNCNVTATKVLEASGNSKVTITGGHLNGSVAIDASANAKIELLNVKVKGSSKKRANAKISIQ